jgi:phosphatidylinositol-3-phosphatase
MPMKQTIIVAATCLAAGAHAHGAILSPSKVVVVVLQDRASDAIAHPKWDYLNSVAASGLVYTNSHGVTHPSTPNSLAIYSGSTQGITDNGRHHSFTAPTLADRLFGAGLSFSGYAESLPADGSQVSEAGNSEHPDLYTRNINPMAMFPSPANQQVNKTFASFPTGDFASLPTVSYVIPNNLNNSHGSNEAEPWAGSPDEEDNDILRDRADNWLAANIDAYLQWAKTNNSLLIITQDEERWTGGSSPTITTIVNGDEDLFVAGTNNLYFNHYNLLRTLTDMYGLDPLGVTGSYSAFTTDSSGKLTVPEPAALSLLAVGGLMLARRKRVEAVA